MFFKLQGKDWMGWISLKSNKFCFLSGGQIQAKLWPVVFEKSFTIPPLSQSVITNYKTRRDLLQTVWFSWKNNNAFI